VDFCKKSNQLITDQFVIVNEFSSTTQDMRKPLFLPLFLLALFICSSPALHAQKANTLSGYLRDADNGENLIGASIYVESLGIGTLSNDYGFYSLTIPSRDSVTVTFAYTGYITEKRIISLRDGDLTLNQELGSANTTLEDVVITAETTYEEELNSTQMSVASVDVSEAKVIPALFGEVDIIKTLQLKPGVQSGGEGTSGLYVRGGGPDQNLIVLDEAVVYNASHLFGLFSTFNSDAVKDVKLYKGGFPAQFGGRLSSVVDIKLRDGNRQKFSGQGGIGSISSRLTLEGPIRDGKGSFIVAGRRTYFDVFTRLINEASSGNENFTPIPDYYFYDLNAKVNYEFGEKDRVFISGDLGKDVFGFNADNFGFDFDWGNITTTVRWNHLFSPKMFMNTTFTFSDYNYTINNQFAQLLEFEIGSKIRDYNLKSDFYYIPNNRHTIRFGASITHHRFTIGRAEVNSSDSTFNFQTGTDLFAQEGGIYISDDFEVNSRLSLNAGLRLSGFRSGDGTFYGGLEPRASAKFSLSERVALKASFTQMFQYIHLVSNSGASLPTDIWFPSTERVRPQRARQVAAGITIQLGDKFLISNEYYYKWLNNQIDFKDNANLFVNEGLVDEFIFGEGWAYGTEIYLQKKTGRLTGWIGYTLAWSWRRFDGSFAGPEPGILDIINDGEPFHPRYDRRHDVSVVAIYDLLDKKWQNRRGKDKRVKLSLTGAWVYGTGNATSLPVGRSFISDYVTNISPANNSIIFDLFGEDPRLVPVFTDRNAFRLPAYHRMDIGMVATFFPKWGESDLTLSFYNAYNRRNAFFIFFDQDDNRLSARQVTLFPIIPSLTYNFKF
jgi:hypothetical protein